MQWECPNRTRIEVSPRGHNRLPAHERLVKNPNLDYKIFMSWTLHLDTHGHVHVQVIGYLEVDEARDSGSAIAALYSGQSREIYIEADQMRGYRRGARAVWQERLFALRNRIPRLVLVGGNSVVRMSTSVIAMGIGVPMLVKKDQSLSPGEGEDAPVQRRRRRSAPRSRLASRPHPSAPPRHEAAPRPRKREPSRPA